MNDSTRQRLHTIALDHRTHTLHTPYTPRHENDTYMKERHTMWYKLQYAPSDERLRYNYINEACAYLASHGLIRDTVLRRYYFVKKEREVDRSDLVVANGRAYCTEGSGQKKKSKRQKTERKECYRLVSTQNISYRAFVALYLRRRGRGRVCIALPFYNNNLNITINNIK